MHCYTFRESEQKPWESNEVLSEYKLLRNGVIVVMYFKPRFSKARWCPTEWMGSEIVVVGAFFVRESAEWFLAVAVSHTDAKVSKHFEFIVENLGMRLKNSDSAKRTATFFRPEFRLLKSCRRHVDVLSMFTREFSLVCSFMSGTKTKIMVGANVLGLIGPTKKKIALVRTPP